MTEPATVIVATEHESVVRFYAGHAGNGGMNQTGQFTTTKPLDPTDLANMAVDLAATFGWLQVQPVEPVRNLREVAPPAVVPEPPTEPKPGQSELRKFMCPFPGCERVMQRGNLQRHLIDVHHQSRERALQNLRGARPANGKESKPAPKPRTANGVARWDQIVMCPEPGCGKQAKRSNMVTHLQGQKHAYGRERSSEVVRDLPVVDTLRNPSRHGLSGAREINETVLPRVLATMRTIDQPATTSAVATAMHTQPHLALSWLRKLEANGTVVQTNAGAPAGVQTLWATRENAEPAPPPTVETAPPPPVEFAQAIAPASTTDYDAGSTHVHERNEPE